MNEITEYDRGFSSPRWPWFVIGTCCLALIFFLKYEGVVLAILISALAYLAIRFQPNSAEATALQSSILLSLEDIDAVLDEFHKFLYSSEADYVADRTLQRPALTEANSTDPDIEQFWLLAKSSKNFTKKIRLRLRRPLQVAQLEQLLTLTDARVEELQAAWSAARRAALRRGL